MSSSLQAGLSSINSRLGLMRELSDPSGNYFDIPRMLVRRRYPVLHQGGAQ